MTLNRPSRGSTDWFNDADTNWTTIQTALNALTGAIIPFGSTTAPSGWLVCDGSNVSRTTYADLFAIIGTTFGSGDGSTTFTLPDMRARIPMGYNNSGNLGSGATVRTNKAMASSGGEENHTLTASEVAKHTHPITDSGHSHAMTSRGSDLPQGGNGRFADGAWTVTNGPSTASSTTGITVNQQSSGDGSHINMQPYLTLQYIIKT